MSATASTIVLAAMTQELETVAATASVHARDLDSDAEIGMDPDGPVALASVFKIPVLLELTRQAAAGECRLTDRVQVPGGDRSPGPTGLSVMLDPIEMSLRDLGYLMMSVSDNAAADVLIDLVGLDRVNSTLATLGLASTHLAGNCRQMLDSLAQEAGFDSMAHFAETDPAMLSLQRDQVVEDLRRASTTSAVDSARGTARDTTLLLQKIWRNEAAPADACAEVRRIMALQVFRDRLASGFPDDTIKLSGKTGTLPFLRNEAAVVEYPDGGRYAVAVFTRATDPTLRQPGADRLVGTLGRFAVDYLRGKS